jgi:hypothetical protein
VHPGVEDRRLPQSLRRRQLEFLAPLRPKPWRRARKSPRALRSLTDAMQWRGQCPDCRL